MIVHAKYHQWGVRKSIFPDMVFYRTPETVHYRRLILITVIAMGFFTRGIPVRAENGPPILTPTFKVQSSVDLGDEKAALSLSTTLFDAGKAFDFLEKPLEITIINWQQNRVTLLNPRGNEQVELSFDAILRFQERVESRARSVKDPRQRFSANPEFEIRLDEPPHDLVFTSYWLTYRIRTRDNVAPEVVRDFLRFSDLMARLNCLLVQGSRLPGPRLKVNQILAEKGLFPEEVILINGPKNFLEWLPGRRTVIRSTHNLVLGLTPEDRNRMKQAEQWSQSFRRVNFLDYQSRLTSN